MRINCLSKLKRCNYLVEVRSLIEIKQLKKEASEERIKAELSDALKQITNNKYYKELIAHKVQNRIEMAMVFVEKEVYLEVN